jgi:hypothetical protein
MLDDLADDQLAEALALAWVGRGTFDNSEWETRWPRRTTRIPNRRSTS